MPDEVDYFIGLETVTHIGNEKLRRVRVSYYQWAPLILLVQGLCFYIPFLIWNSCANNAGVKLRRLLKKASDIASLPPGCQQREALLAEFVDQFHTLVTGEAGWCADLQCGLGGGASGGGLAGGAGGSSSLSGSSNSSSGSSGGGGPAANGPAGRPPRPGAAPNHDAGADGHGGGRRGQSDRSNNDRQRGGGGGGGQDDGQQQAGCCLVGIPIIGSLLSCCLKPCTSFALVGPSKYLCLLYLAVKTAYVLNVVLQFFLLGQFLGRGYLKHGLELINRLIVNGDWWASPRFPLSTLCQVRADMSGGLRSYTCQCVLPINVFNEKIFSVVWFYMAFLMPLNVLSLLFWIYRTFETNRLSYIRLCLWRTRLVELNQIHRTVRRLSQSYLGWDGVFLLRLIEHNHGSIMATLIMSRLWEFYANQMKLQEDANQLALANNAHQTLAQTNTLLSHHQQQHQQQHPAQQHQHSHHGPGGGAGANQQHGHQHPQLLGAGGHAPLAGHHHGAGGHHHGGGGGHHGGPHSHALPPLMPSQPQQQQHFGSGGHAHATGPQHTSFTGGGGGGGGPAHGPHGHHSGQISQPGHHPPLHAANTHVAAGHTRHHLAGAFPAGTVSAGLLAQLQHQQQQQQHHHPAAPQPNQPAPGMGNNQAPQQPVLGNVKAVAAALAGAAAAATHSTANPASSGQAGPTSQQQQSSTTTTNSNNNNSNSSSNIIGGSGTQSQPSAAANHHLGQSSGGAGIHLHSLLQSAAAAGGGGGGPASAPNQQQQQQGPQATQLAAVQQQLTSLAAAAAASPAAGASGQPAAATSSHPAANVAAQQTTTTTSFMNAPGAGGPTALGQQQQPQPQVGSANPPLPPPPPAHVVAAVAAAAANLSGPIACDRSTNLKNQPAPSRTKQPTAADQDEGRAKNFL